MKPIIINYEGLCLVLSGLLVILFVTFLYYRNKYKKKVKSTCKTCKTCDEIKHVEVYFRDEEKECYDYCMGIEHDNKKCRSQCYGCTQNSCYNYCSQGCSGASDPDKCEGDCRSQCYIKPFTTCAKECKHDHPGPELGTCILQHCYKPPPL